MKESSTLQWPGDRQTGGQTGGQTGKDDRVSLRSDVSLREAVSWTESERELMAEGERRGGGAGDYDGAGLMTHLEEEAEPLENHLPEKAAQVFSPAVTVLPLPSSPREGEAFWEMESEKSPFLSPRGAPQDYNQHGYQYEWTEDPPPASCLTGVHSFRETAKCGSLKCADPELGHSHCLCNFLFRLKAAGKFFYSMAAFWLRPLLLCRSSQRSRRTVRSRFESNIENTINEDSQSELEEGGSYDNSGGWGCPSRDVLKVGVSLMTSALFFPFLVWGGFVFLPFDAPLLDGAPLRLVYTLRCSVFAAAPIVLGWLVLGVSRLRYGVIRPLFDDTVKEAQLQEVSVHQRFVSDSTSLFLIYFLQLVVMAIYLSQEQLKLVPLLTVVFAFGRLVYWVAAAFGSSIRGFGFGLSFLPSLVMMAANTYFIFTVEAAGSIFSLPPLPEEVLAPPAGRQRFWG